MNVSAYDLSVWVLPLVFAITFHEAAHGFVAYHLGDDTAWKLTSCRTSGPSMRYRNVI